MATSPGLGSLCAMCWHVASGKSLHLAQPQFHRLERGGGSGTYLTGASEESVKFIPGKTREGFLEEAGIPEKGTLGLHAKPVGD